MSALDEYKTETMTLSVDMDIVVEIGPGADGDDELQDILLVSAQVGSKNIIIYPTIYDKNCTAKSLLNDYATEIEELVRRKRHDTRAYLEMMK